MLQSHLTSQGLRFGIWESKFFPLLEKLMGAERFANWKEVREARQFGLANISEEYELLKTRDEASLVFSPQAEVTWEIYHWLDKKAEAFVKDDYQLLDLGCGSGLLVSWFAKQFPKLKIAGADNSVNLLARTCHPTFVPSVDHSTFPSSLASMRC